MNHTGLKADNKGPGIFPRKKVWILIPRSHVSLLLGVVAVKMCCKLWMVSVIYVLLLELLGQGLVPLGSHGNPFTALALDNRYPYSHCYTDTVVLHCSYAQIYFG